MKEYNKALYPFTSKWVNIDGNNIHYIDEGEGEIILFSHPPLGSSFMFRDFVQILRKKHRCIAIDFPGFGLSEKSDNYQPGVESQSYILEKFIKQLGLQNIYGLGHDTGGPSLNGVALRNPDLFNGLILTDTVIFPISEYAKLSKTLGIVGGRFFIWFNATTNILVKATFKFGVRTRKLSKAERLEYQRMFDTASKRKRITAMLLNLKQSERYMRELKQGFEQTLNDKPTLLIYGEDDPVTKLGIADRIFKMLENSELYLINKEGHFPHEGQPEKMSNIIHDWIGRISVANS